MRLLCCHPSGLLYTEIYLRLEPLGLELVAAAARAAGHEVRILDLQVAPAAAYHALLAAWRPQAIGFSLNYLANLPEVVDLAKAAKAALPGCLVFVGGHSASFTAWELLEHAGGAIDAVVRGEGEAAVAGLLAAARERGALQALPGILTPAGAGPPPPRLSSLDGLIPARDLLPHRRRYFIGVLDPAASIEFSRGCPWDCTFCSAWTFYARSHRLRSPEAVVEELAGIREPNLFIVDDVAFVQSQHAMAIGEAVARRGIRKRYYLETRGDVLLKNLEVFRFWKRLGLQYMFLGMEAIDEETLQAHRKRIRLSKSLEALEAARSLGITTAVNLIADPDWDEGRFRAVRDWALAVPEIVNITVNTPYPGTETFLTESRRLSSRDYRLFDIQHAVLPTRLPLDRFYRELVSVQAAMNRKHLGFTALRKTAGTAARLLLRGQTSFLRMLWKFNTVYDPARLLADHAQPVRYELRRPEPQPEKTVDPRSLYVLAQESAR